MSRDENFSPRSYARICGVLYLIIIAAGLFAQNVRDRFIVPGNAAATASNITGDAFLFRLGLTADLSTFVCAVPVTILLYALLKPVSRHVAMVMVVFAVVQEAIGAVNVLNTYRPLQLLGGAAYLNVFSREQLEAMAQLSLNTHSVGFNVAMIFFGFSCLAMGWLIYASGFVPKIIGVLIVIAGLCYLTLSAAQLLAPRLVPMLFPSIFVPPFIGELSFALWLTVKGVDVGRWQERAAHPTASS